MRLAGVLRELSEHLQRQRLQDQAPAPGTTRWVAISWKTKHLFSQAAWLQGVTLQMRLVGTEEIS